MVAPRIELSSAVLSGPSRQPVLDYLVRRRGHPAPGLAGCRVATVSDRGSRAQYFADSRRRMARQPLSSPYGNRTHLSALKGQYPSPIDERAVVCVLYARTLSAEWAGRRSNPRYLIFSQALYRLSYQPKVNIWLASSIGRSQRKRPGVAVTPGLVAHQRVRPSVIFAYFFRWRARNPAVHSPVGQMSRSTAAPSAISV